MEMLIDHIKNIDDQTKKLIKIFGVLVVILIFLSIVFFIKRNVFDINTESKIEKRIVNLTKDYYKNFLYDKYQKDELVKYSTNGIKLTLYSIIYETNIEKTSDFYLDKEDKYCDLFKTIIKIYPKEPYSAEAFDVEVEMVFSKDR